MKKRYQKICAVLAIVVFTIITVGLFVSGSRFDRVAFAQDSNSKAEPGSTPEFDQEAALAKLRKEIKGKEKLPAGEVFKNIKNFKQIPAGRLLAIMKFGYARSLGVNCTHCHTPENFASEVKPAKQIARDMHVMAGKINGELLSSMKAFEGRTGRNRPVINCTTCHRGEVIPATNLPRPKPLPLPEPKQRKEGNTE